MARDTQNTEDNASVPNIFIDKDIASTPSDSLNLNNDHNFIDIKNVSKFYG